MNPTLHSRKELNAVPTPRAAMRFLALMLWSLLLVLGRAASAQVTGAKVTPANLPKEGGSIGISANIDPDFEISSIVVLQGTSIVAPMGYIATNTDGTKQYLAVLNIPGNGTTSPQTYTYAIRAVGTSTQVVDIAAGTVTVAPQPYITLTNITLTPNTMTANGGSYTITAKAYAYGGASIGNIGVYRNGSSVGNLTYVPNNSNANNYTGTFTFRPNGTDSPGNNLIVLRANDNSGNVQAAVAGTITQDAVTPVSIVSASVSTITLPAGGGSLTVNAKVSALAPNDISSVTVSRNGGSLGGLNYVSLNSDGTKNYTGTFAFTKNVSDTPLVYAISLRVADNASNVVTQTFTNVTQAAVTPIRVVSVTASTQNLPASGGGVTINAVVDVPAPNDVNTVSLAKNGSNLGTLAFVNNNADGTKNYTGTFAFPANQTNAPLVGGLVLRAADSAGNNVYVPVPTVTTATPVPVSIVSAAVSTTSLPSAGGPVTITAVVNAPAPNGVNSINVSRSGGSPGSLTYIDTNSDGTKNYAGTFTLPAAGNAAARAILTLAARDNSSNYAFKTLPVITVGTGVVGTPAQIVSATLVGSSIPAEGGNFVVTARIKATDASKISSLVVYNGTDYEGQLLYQNANNDGTFTYSGSFSVGRSVRAVAQASPVTLLVIDSSGNQDVASVGIVTQNPVAPVTITAATLGTASFPAAGGTETINATLRIPYPNGLNNIVAYANGTYAGNLIYLYPNADGTANYIGALAIGSSRTDVSRADHIALFVTDNVGNSVYVPLGSVMVAAMPAVRITAASLTNTDIPAAGSNVLVNATVSVPTPNTIYNIGVFSSGAYIGNLTLLNTNADGTANYLGAFDVAPNRSDLARTDTYSLIATDNVGNNVFATLGSVQVHAAQPVAITASAISVKPSGTVGGDAIISATVKAAFPNTVYDIQVTGNGPYVGGLKFQNLNADGTANYSGSFPLPTSSNGIPQPFLYTLTAFDSLGNIATAVLNQSAPTMTAVNLSGTVTLAGEVANAALQTVTFEFRPQDGSENFTRTTSVGQDGIFQLNDIPRKQYDVWVKSEKNLAQTVPVNTTNGDVTNFSVTLPGGDANNDNTVDIADFGLLVNVYGSDANVANSGYDPRPDFNGDGVVDIADFGLLVNNYGLTGAN